MTSQTRGVKPQSYRVLIDAAIDQGWTLVHTGSGHLKLTPPDGGPPVFCATTSGGGGRAVPNLRSRLRKQGVIC